MRIFFKKKIGELIIDAQMEADLQDKEIDHILLTKREAYKLHREFRPVSTRFNPHGAEIPCVYLSPRDIPSGKFGVYGGTKLEVE